MQGLLIDDQGLVIVERIVAVGPAESAPMRRLLAALPLTKVINLTGGQRRQSVLILDSDHVVITPLSVAEVEAALTEPVDWTAR